MWDNLSITGDLDWISASIADNSCIAVTDGLYMKEMYPYLNSVAFVFECSEGRGQLMGSSWSIHQMLAAIAESF